MSSIVCTHVHYLNKQNMEHNDTRIYVLIIGDAVVIQQLPDSRNMHVRTRARPPAYMPILWPPNGR